MCSDGLYVSCGGVGCQGVGGGGCGVMVVVMVVGGAAVAPVCSNAHQLNL